MVGRPGDGGVPGSDLACPVNDYERIQFLTDERKRLQKIVDELAATIRSQRQKIRDADVYIQVLEDENELFQQRISELEGGSSVEQAS